MLELSLKLNSNEYKVIDDWELAREGDAHTFFTINEASDFLSGCKLSQEDKENVDWLLQILKNLKNLHIKTYYI